ncbi:MAG: glycoside hydrolase family 3 protein [Bdellovibrionales bacterium]
MIQATRFLSRTLLGLLILLTSLAQASEAPGNAWIEKRVRKYVGQMLIVGFRGLSVDKDHIIVRDIQHYNLGGVILFDYDYPTRTFDRNILNGPQVKTLNQQLQSFAKTPLFITVDQEGGLVQRLKPRWGFPAASSALELSQRRQQDPTAILESSRSMAQTLRDHGFNWNFAPVVDLASNPENPIIAKVRRAFSADPIAVAQMSEEFIVGHRDRGVLTSIKHFPGHGSSRQDSHLGFTDVTTTWAPEELIPFQKLIDRNRADSVMISHVFHRDLDADWPASMSKKIITDLLRDKMKYNGIIVTDDLQMAAIRDNYSFEDSALRPLKAGSDVLIFGNMLRYEEDVVPRVIELVTKAVERNELSLDQLRKSYLRIQAIKKRLRLSSTPRNEQAPR